MGTSWTQAATRACNRASAIASASVADAVVVLITMAWIKRASGPVVAVDLDVALGQIARPHVGARPTDADIDEDLQLGVLHVAAHRRLVVGRRDRPVLSGPKLAEPHAHAVAVDRL